MFNELNLQQVYRDYEETSYAAITSLIDDLQLDLNENKQIVQVLILRIIALHESLHCLLLVRILLLQLLLEEWLLLASLFLLSLVDLCFELEMNVLVH